MKVRRILVASLGAVLALNIGLAACTTGTDDGVDVTETIGTTPTTIATTTTAAS